MNGVLLDTDVFSFAFKQDPRIAPYVRHMTGVRLYLSFQSVAELRYWAEVRRWGTPRKNQLELAMKRHAILPSDDAMSSLWAATVWECRRVGRPIECNDAWIAATALCHNLTLLTHNASDFAGVKHLRLISYPG
jgi:tRNA(fMet)-specific endonuclease VapC